MPEGSGPRAAFLVVQKSCQFCLRCICLVDQQRLNGYRAYRRAKFFCPMMSENNMEQILARRLVKLGYLPRVRLDIQRP
jgi:hypothetical protein